MKPGSFRFFIKQKKIVQDRIAAQIASLDGQIASLQRQIEANLQRIGELGDAEYQTLFELQNAQAGIAALRKENATISQQITKLQEQITERKKELAAIHAEKKALEKLQEKERKKRQHKQTELENRLANESFVHKLLHHN